MKNPSNEKVYEIIGRLHVQVWMAGEEISESSQRIAELTQENENLRELMNSLRTSPNDSIPEPEKGKVESNGPSTD